MSDQQKRRLRSVLPFALAVLPAIFISFSILKYGVDTPLWDEWLVGGYLDKFAKGALSFQDLFAQQNEYRQFFPNLIFVSLGWFTKWDVRSWMVVSFLLAGLTSFNIYHLGKWSQAETGWTYFIANLIIFSPIQYENWLQGQQLIYFLPIACFTASLLVASARDIRIGARFGLCALASLISSFSSANGMLCWMLLFPVLAWPSSRDGLWQKKWWLGGWITGFILTVALYFHGYHSIPGHNPLALTHKNPLNSFLYFLVILGRPLAPRPLVAAASAGFVLISLFIWSWFGFWRAQRNSLPQAHRLLCWLMLGAYSILTAALITIGRFDPDYGLVFSASRYTTYSIYLPVALVYLVPMTLGKGSQPLRLLHVNFSGARLLTFLGVALVGMHFPIYRLGIRQMSTFRVASLQAKACYLFVNVVEDECLQEKVSPDIATLKQNINLADRLGFIRPGLIKTNHVNDILNTQARREGNRGAFQSLIHTGGDKYVASGWAVLRERGEPADAVLLTYEDQSGIAAVFAIADLSPQRDFVSALFARAVNGDPRWSKSFSLNAVNSDPVKLSAWGFDALTGKAYKLDGEHVIQKSDLLTELKHHVRHPD